MAPPAFDRSHWSFAWSVSPNMSLYTAATTSHPGQSRPNKLGEVVAARFTKAQKDEAGNSPPSFLLSVLYTPDRDASQDVDNPPPREQVWFIVQESLYTDFTNVGWQTHPQLVAAAARARSSNNHGKWFKEFVKNNHCTDYDAELSFQPTPSGETQTSTPSRVVVGSSAPLTPNPSNSRPQVTPGVFPAAALPPPSQPQSIISASQEAAVGRAPAARSPMGVCPRVCSARAKIVDDNLYRKPPNHPQISHYTPHIYINEKKPTVHLRQPTQHLQITLFHTTFFCLYK